MKFAFVFPGQGSQSVGMLNVFSGWPVVQETLAQASDVLELDIGALIASGPADALILTFSSQPALLAAAGARAVDDALKPVRIRAQIRQEAEPEGAGSMAAILGLDAQSVRALCTA